MLQSLKRLLPLTPYSPYSVPFASSRTIQIRLLSSSKSKTPSFPSSPPTTGEDEWNDAWESAWLPRDLTPESRAPWESDVSFPSATAASAEVDAETKAFVAEMDEQWGERRAARRSAAAAAVGEEAKDGRRERKKEGDEYRVRKQRIHAGLWMKEIERMEEARIGDDSAANAGDDIDRLLDSCSEIFDFGNTDLNDSKTPSTAEFKTKPDGWETTSKTQDGNIWEISQREEDILLQEFERRIAFSKFQIASFIKTHIFSRRRPIDGWKYMIEVIGPNARKGKGSVQRLPSLADPSTQPFREEKPAIAANFTSFRGR